MDKIEVVCQMSGDDFYPSKLSLNSNVVLNTANDPGDLYDRGTLKGQVNLVGRCSITSPENIPYNERINWLLDHLISNIGVYKSAGAKEFGFWVYWYGIQGNMEFEYSTLERIAELKMNLCVTYMQEN